MGAAFGTSTAAAERGEHERNVKTPAWNTSSTGKFLSSRTVPPTASCYVLSLFPGLSRRKILEDAGWRDHFIWKERTCHFLDIYLFFF